MYEVFYPISGIAVYRTRYRWYAILLAWWYGMDWAKEGMDG
jgi:hypothetical protein